MSRATDADLAAWGIGHYLLGQNAFTAAPPKGKRCKPCTAPKKRGPKPNRPKTQQAAMALETPAERKARQFQERQQKALDRKGRATVGMAPRTTGAITIYSKADTDKTRSLARGRLI